MSALSFGFAQKHGVFLHEKDREGISSTQQSLVCRRDATLDSLLEVRRILGEECPLRIVDDDTFAEDLERTYSGQLGRLADVGNVEQSIIGLDEAAMALQEPDDLLKSKDGAPIIKILNAVFAEAIQEKASDIHIEPYTKDVRIRFRVNGVLRTVLKPSVKICPLLVSRIKVLAHLDIAEKRVPQDGRITMRLGGREVDFRVSTLPSSFGERVVLRLLDKKGGMMHLTQLGMDRKTKNQFKRLTHLPHGIVLVTGPTGSGKTTTLYAALDQIDRRARNIMTVEDPVEYNFEGISQTQVNTKAGMTFARGLRAILRQDPDVVLIGEIRDEETVNIAVQASLTGHLVLSTLHTNTAVGAITRLMDMQVEPFLLAATLRGALAQRLVRRLCKECREGYVGDTEALNFCPGGS